MFNRRAASQSKPLKNLKQQYSIQKFDPSAVYLGNYGQLLIPTSKNQNNQRRLSYSEQIQYKIYLEEKNRKNLIQNSKDQNASNRAKIIDLISTQPHSKKSQNKAEAAQQLQKKGILFRQPKDYKQDNYNQIKRQSKNQAISESQVKLEGQFSQQQSQKRSSTFAKKESILILKNHQSSFDENIQNYEMQRSQLNASLKQFKEEIIQNLINKIQGLQNLISHKFTKMDNEHRYLKQISNKIQAKIEEKFQILNKKRQREIYDCIQKSIQKYYQTNKHISEQRGHQIRQKQVARKNHFMVVQQQQVPQKLQSNLIKQNDKLKSDLLKAKAANKFTEQSLLKLQQKYAVNQKKQQLKIKQLENKLFQAEMQFQQAQSSNKRTIQRQQQLAAFHIKSSGFSSNILNINDLAEAKTFINKQIQSFQDKKIQGVQLIFQKDGINSNFGVYLETQCFPLLLLVQTQQKVVFGAFSQGYKSSKNTQIVKQFEQKQKIRAFLFNATKQLVFTNVRESSLAAAKYVDSMLMFGNSEMYLKNNSLQSIIVHAGNIISQSYYLVKHRKDLTNSQSHQVKIQRLQIHRIHFQRL